MSLPLGHHLPTTTHLQQHMILLLYLQLQLLQQHKTTMHHLPTILATHLQNQTAAKTEPNYYPSIKHHIPN